MAVEVEPRKGRMSVEECSRRFYEDGYVCLDDVVPSELLEDANAMMVESLGKLLGKPVRLAEGIISASEQYRQFDVQCFLHHELQAGGFKRRLFLLEAVLEPLLHLLGPDLAYCRDNMLVCNIHGVTDGLYQKKWHQELWSGSCLHEVDGWVPLMMEPNIGGVEFIPGSHLWGLIPNQNREPKELPQGHAVVTPEAKEGTLMLFHPLTLHRTVPNTSRIPRVAMSLSVRNFYHPMTGHGHLRGWEPFHFSAVAQVEKALGNPWLTPFRTLGGSLSHTHPDDGKQDISRFFE